MKSLNNKIKANIWNVWNAVDIRESNHQGQAHTKTNNEREQNIDYDYACAGMSGYVCEWESETDLKLLENCCPGLIKTIGYLICSVIYVQWVYLCFELTYRLT